MVVLSKVNMARRMMDLCVLSHFPFWVHDNKVEMGLIDILEGVTNGTECYVPLMLVEILVGVHKANDLKYQGGYAMLL